MYRGFEKVDDEFDTPIESLILDLSLASAFPITVSGQNLFKGTASMQALAYRTAKMGKHELKTLEYVMGPLLGLMSTNLHHPIAAKASFGIRTLIATLHTPAHPYTSNGRRGE